MEHVAEMAFSHIGYLEALEVVSSIEVYWEEVEYMLNIFDGVDVAVDIYIIIIGGDGSQAFCVIVHFHA